MAVETICKIVHQYNRAPVSPEDMGKLLEIAEDYRKVKNYVYERYGGIGSLAKLYPGYTIQNEMTKTDLRQRLGMPSVYFYLAIFDALGDIKSQWTRTKKNVLTAVAENEQFTAQDRHYLRFVIKVSSCFENILTGKEMIVPKAMEEAYQNASKGVDRERMNRYLCRQIRRKLKKLHTDRADGFGVTERAYRYGDHGIYISTKEKRKRVFVLLTDENQYKRQIYIKLRPEKSEIEISVPIEVRVWHHIDYENKIGLSAGVWKMFTTDSGNVYGEDYGKLHMEFVEFIRASDHTYRREKENNPGREKYKNKKARLNEKIQVYVNQEIKRMLETEKPKIIYIPKLPRLPKAGVSRQVNFSITVWKRGYVRKRLEQKCKENAVEIVEVFGNGISTECSECGRQGTAIQEKFCCAACGYTADKKVNAARNAKKRGISGQKLNQEHPLRSEKEEVRIKPE